MEDGIGNGSITLTHKVLSAMFNHGVSEDYIRRNYAYGFTKTKGMRFCRYNRRSFQNLSGKAKNTALTIGHLSFSLKKDAVVVRKLAYSGKI